MTVSFIITRSSGDIAATTIACLELEEIAVMAGAAGGVTMNVSDNLPLPATNSEDYMEAVSIGRALKESTTKGIPIATVTSSFLSFQGDLTDTDDANDSMQVDTVGMLNVEADGDMLNATNGDAVTAEDLYDDGGNTANPEATEGTSAVNIMGDFSFATRVTLNGAATCTDAENDADLRMDMVDDMRDTTKLKTQNLEYVLSKYLCISVAAADSDDAVAIPETAPYSAMVMYAGGAVTDPVYPAKGMQQELGYIKRDGTTVRLPYLTTNDKFNQRIYIVNRGGEAKYYLTFGADAEKGMMADGTLAAKATTVLSLRTDDIVTIGGGRSSTSGTLIVEAQKKDIDVATTQISRELGTTDTVVYEIE
jgi:hypothetical protein